jgi:hypothetical protein
MEREPVSASTENWRALLGELRMRSVLIDIRSSDRYPLLHSSWDPSQQRVSVHWDIGASLREGNQHFCRLILTLPCNFNVLRLSMFNATA